MDSELGDVEFMENSDGGEWDGGDGGDGGEGGEGGEGWEEAAPKSKSAKTKTPGVTRRGRGRPRNPVQATVVGGSNQELLVTKKKKKKKKCLPKFDDGPGRESGDFDVPTDDLVDRLGSRDSRDSRDAQSSEDIEAAIDYYEELWVKYPHLTLVPGLARQRFDPNTCSLEEVEKAIGKVEDLGEKPFRDKMYTQAWNLFAFFVGQVVSVTPLGPVLEPEKTALNPRAATLSDELMSEPVVKEAKPVVEEIFQMFPLLDYLNDLNDPRLRLTITILSAAHTVYRKNSALQSLQQGQR